MTWPTSCSGSSLLYSWALAPSLPFRQQLPVLVRTRELTQRLESLWTVLPRANVFGWAVLARVLSCRLRSVMRMSWGIFQPFILNIPGEGPSSQAMEAPHFLSSVLDLNFFLCLLSVSFWRKIWVFLEGNQIVSSGLLWQIVLLL